MKVCRREIEKSMGVMLKYAYALSRDSDLACDLVQDSIVKALSARDLPKRHESYQPWLFSILRNVFFDQLRRRRRQNDYVRDTVEQDLRDSPEQRIEESLINRITVRAGLDRLSDAHREILVLVDIAGFSYGEVANLLGVPRGTVMSRLSRARHSLRQEISTENLHMLESVGQPEHRKTLR